MQNRLFSLNFGACGGHSAQLKLCCVARWDELEDDHELEAEDEDEVVCPAVDAKYRLSSKHAQLARYRRTYPWFEHDEPTGTSWCSTCKR